MIYLKTPDEIQLVKAASDLTSRTLGEVLGEILADAEPARKCGQDGDNAKEKRAGKGDTAHDGVEILNCGFAGFHSGKIK